MAQSKNDLKHSYSLTSWRKAPGPRRLIGTVRAYSKRVKQIPFNSEKKSYSIYIKQGKFPKIPPPLFRKCPPLGSNRSGRLSKLKVSPKFFQSEKCGFTRLKGKYEP